MDRIDGRRRAMSTPLNGEDLLSLEHIQNILLGNLISQQVHSNADQQVEGTPASRECPMMQHLPEQVVEELELRGLEKQTSLFNLKQIKSATRDFDPSNKIGEGGFGAVYKGS